MEDTLTFGQEFFESMSRLERDFVQSNPGVDLKDPKYADTRRGWMERSRRDVRRSVYQDTLRELMAANVPGISAREVPQFSVQGVAEPDLSGATEKQKAVALSMNQFASVDSLDDTFGELVADPDSDAHEFAVLRQNQYERGGKMRYWDEYLKNKPTKTQAAMQGLIINATMASEGAAKGIGEYVGGVGAGLLEPQFEYADMLGISRVRFDSIIAKAEGRPSILSSLTGPELTEDEKRVYDTYMQMRGGMVEGMREEVGKSFQRTARAVTDTMIGVGGLAPGAVQARESLVGSDPTEPQDIREEFGRAGGGALVKTAEMAGSAIGILPYSIPALSTRNPRVAAALTSQFYAMGHSETWNRRMRIWEEQAAQAKELGLPAPARPSFSELEAQSRLGGAIEFASEYTIDRLQVALPMITSRITSRLPRAGGQTARSVQDGADALLDSMARRRGPLGAAKGALVVGLAGATEGVEEAIPELGKELIDPLYIPEGYENDFFSGQTAEAIGTGIIAGLLIGGGQAAFGQEARRRRRANRQFREVAARGTRTVVGALTDKASRESTRRFASNAVAARGSTMAMSQVEDMANGRRTAMLVDPDAADTTMTEDVRQKMDGYQISDKPIGRLGRFDVYAMPGMEAEVRAYIAAGNTEKITGYPSLMEPDLPMVGALVVRNNSNQIVDVIPYSDSASADAAMGHVQHVANINGNTVENVREDGLAAVSETLALQHDADAVARSITPPSKRQMSQGQKDRGVEYLRLEIGNAANLSENEGSDARFRSSLLTPEEIGDATNADVDVEVTLDEVQEDSLSDGERKVGRSTGITPTVLDANVKFTVRRPDGKVDVYNKNPVSNGAYLGQQSPDGIFLIRENGSVFTAHNAFVTAVHELRHRLVGRSRGAAAYMAKLLYLDPAFAMRGGVQYMRDYSAVAPGEQDEAVALAGLTDEQVVARYAGMHAAAMAVLEDKAGYREAVRTKRDPNATQEQVEAADVRIEQQRQAEQELARVERFAEESVTTTAERALGQTARGGVEWETIYRDARGLGIRKFRAFMAHIMAKNGFAGPEARQAVFEARQRMDSVDEAQLQIDQKMREEVERKYREDLEAHEEMRKAAAEQAQQQQPAPQQQAQPAPQPQAQQAAQPPQAVPQPPAVPPAQAPLPPQTMYSIPGDSEEKIRSAQDALSGIAALPPEERPTAMAALVSTLASMIPMLAGTQASIVPPVSGGSRTPNLRFPQGVPERPAPQPQPVEAQAEQPAAQEPAPLPLRTEAERMIAERERGTEPMLSIGRAPKRLYSALAREIDAIPSTALPRSTWEERIRGLVASGKVKESEIEWNGLRDFLALQGPSGVFRKDEIAAFLKGNQVKVKIDLRGGSEAASEFTVYQGALDGLLENLRGTSSDTEEFRRDVERYRALVPFIGEEFGRDERNQIELRFAEATTLQLNDSLAFSKMVREERNRLRDEGLIPRGETVYEAYTEPGGSGYREMLLTLPEVEMPTRFPSKEGMDARGAVFEKYQPQLAEVERKLHRATFESPYNRTDAAAEERVEFGNLRDEIFAARSREADAAYKVPEPQKVSFTGPHFGNTKNIVAHVRMKDRRTGDGKRILFIEEVQSDWAQQGRSQGFGVGEYTAENLRVRQVVPLGGNQAGQSNVMFEFANGRSAGVVMGADSVESATEIMAKRLDEPGYRQSMNLQGVPRAPFVESTDGWLNLALKQIMLEAVNNGYDGVSFVTGEQSVNRYKDSLTKAVDQIAVKKNADGTYSYDAVKQDEEEGSYSTVSQESSVSAQRLTDLFGKQGGKQLVDAADAAGPDGTTVMSRDIRVGGEGMRKFYDEIVPNAANKLLKKLGGSKVGSMSVNFGATSEFTYGDAAFVVRDATRKLYGELSTNEFETLAQDLGFDGASDLLRNSATANTMRDIGDQAIIEGAENGPSEAIESTKTAYTDALAGRPYAIRAVNEAFAEARRPFDARISANKSEVSQNPGFDVTDAMRSSVADTGGLPMFSMRRDITQNWKATSKAVDDGELTTVYNGSPTGFMEFDSQRMGRTDRPVSMGAATSATTADGMWFTDRRDTAVRAADIANVNMMPNIVRLLNDKTRRLESKLPASALRSFERNHGLPLSDYTLSAENLNEFMANDGSSYEDLVEGHVQYLTQMMGNDPKAVAVIDQEFRGDDITVRAAEIAGSMGGVARAAHLNLQNPLIIPFKQGPMVSTPRGLEREDEPFLTQAANAISAMRSFGHDGLIMEMPDGERRYFVRNPSQVQVIGAGRDATESSLLSLGKKFRDPSGGVGRELARKAINALNPTEQELAATVLDLMKGGTKQDTFIPQKVGGIKSIVRHLTQRRRASGLKMLNLGNEKDRKILSRLLAVEALAHMESAGEVLEWYDKTIRKTLAQAAIVHPELKSDPVAQLVFSMAMAITSQGQNVEANIEHTLDLYTAYKSNINQKTGVGEFPDKAGKGEDKQAQEANLKQANALLKKLGGNGLRQFLATPFTTRELKALGYKIGGELMDEPLLGSSVFGPKIGFGFLSNLTGNFDPVTMDMWFMRLIGRLTGNLSSFKKETYEKQVQRLVDSLSIKRKRNEGPGPADVPKALVEAVRNNPNKAAVDALVKEIMRVHESDYQKNKSAYQAKERMQTEMVLSAKRVRSSVDTPIDAPKSGGQRRQLRDVVRNAVQMINDVSGTNVANAAFQALVWYPEQELYKSLGAKLRVTSQDFSGAMTKALLNRGVSDESIRQAIDDAELGSGVAATARRVDGEPFGQGSREVGRSGGFADAAADDLIAPPREAMMSMRRGLRGVQDEAVLRYLDKYDEVRRLIDVAERRTGTRIADIANPYMGARLLSARLGAMQDRATERYADLLYRMQRAGVSQDEMDEFLVAQHAQERNDYVFSINPAMPDGGSGMMTADANNILQRARNNGRFATLDGFANEWRRLLRNALDQRLASGLINRQTYDNLNSRYKNYVPLRGAPAQINDEDFMDFGESGGRGLSTTGRGLPAAMGRRSAAEGVTSQVGFVQEDTFRRVERNRIGQQFLQLVLALNDPQSAEVVRPMRRAVVGGVVRRMHDPAWMTEPRNFGLYTDRPITINGHDYQPGDLIVIRINNRRLADAMTQPTLELRSFERGLRYVNNAWRFVTTGMGNPAFAPVNLTRDVGTATLNNLASRGLIDTMQMLARWPGAFWNVFRDAWNGGAPTGSYARFVRAGGDQLSWRPNDLEVKRTDFQELARRVQNRNPNDRTLARSLFGWYPAFFTAAETAARVAVYDQRIATGSSREAAALAARDITVDFAKGGMAKPVLNTWYMFLNAGLQGSVNTLRAISRSAALAPSLIMLGFINSAMARAMGGDDEETARAKWDNIPEYEKTSNLFFFDPSGSGEYIKVPLPYGYNVFVSLGSRMADATYGRDNASDVMSGALVDALNAFNPMGGSGITAGGTALVSAAVPTMVRPAIEILGNEDFTGRPIFREQFGKFPGPDSQVAFDGTPQGYIDLAQYMNATTGGDEFKSGVVDISPNTIQYLLGYYLSGMGRNVDRLYKMATSGEEVKPQDIPVMRSFVGDASQDTRTLSQEFYAKAEEIAPIRRRIDVATNEDLPTDQRVAAGSTLTINDLDMAKLVEDYEKQLSELRKSLRASTPEQRDAILEVRRKTLKSAIRDINRLTDGAQGVD